jgi:hypothetical protein
MEGDAMKTTVLLSTALLLLASCKAKGPVATHASLGADAAPLRAAFNADVGKVRVLMLVAPT